MYIIKLAPTDVAHSAAQPAATFEIHAPLDDKLALDPRAWRRSHDRCRVKRSELGKADQYGWLTCRTVASGNDWQIAFGETPHSATTGRSNLIGHRFSVGEAISIRDDSGHVTRLRVASLRFLMPRPKMQQSFLQTTRGSGLVSHSLATMRHG